MTISHDRNLAVLAPILLLLLRLGVIQVLRFSFVFKVWGVNVRVSGSGFRVSGFRFRLSGFRFKVSGFGFRGLGSGFRIEGPEIRGGFGV